jgi:hypothetical protein
MVHGYQEQKKPSTSFNLDIKISFYYWFALIGDIFIMNLTKNI